MKTKYGIGLFILIFVLIYFISYGAYQEYNNQKYTAYEKNVSNNELTNLENGYYLFEVNGYIVVYKNDKKTPYEYTDIKFDDLPHLLKQEIKNGKYIKNEEDLYGFLENYTS